MSTIRRRHVNSIVKLQNDNESWLVDQNEIISYACAYYKDLFTSRNDMSRVHEVLDAVPILVTEKMNADLTKDFTEEELRMDCFGLAPNKAPGLDRYMSRFH